MWPTAEHSVLRVRRRSDQSIQVPAHFPKTLRNGPFSPAVAKSRGLSWAPYCFTTMHCPSRHFAAEAHHTLRGSLDHKGPWSAVRWAQVSQYPSRALLGSRFLFRACWS